MGKEQNSRLHRVKKYVAQHFPEMAKVIPRVSKSGPTSTYVFAIQGRVPEIVRVITNEEGEIIKVSVSR